MKWLFRWMFSSDLLQAYMDGWKAGVNQQAHEPETAEHGLMSHEQYWRGEE